MIHVTVHFHPHELQALRRSPVVAAALGEDEPATDARLVRAAIRAVACNPWGSDARFAASERRDHRSPSPATALDERPRTGRRSHDVRHRRPLPSTPEPRRRIERG